MTTENREDCFKPIGRPVCRFNDLEALVALLIAALLNDPPHVAMAITADMRLLARLDLLSAIAPHTIKNVPLCEELDSILKEMDRCNSARNGIVHSAWTNAITAGGDSLGIHRSKLSTRNRKGLKVGLTKSGVHEIEIAIDAIDTTLSHLMSFIRKLQDRGLLHYRLTLK